MKDEEKQITKYKEQGYQEKKKHQVAPEPEKYTIDEEKMIGSPDMLSDDEKNKFIIHAFFRRFGLMWLLSVLVLPLGLLLVVGAANVLYSEYMMGDIFEEVIAKLFRPMMYWSLGVTVAMAFVSLIVMHFVYSDRKRLAIRANDKLVEKDMEPVLIPRKEGDKNRLIAAFYKVKPPYIIAHVIPVICAVILVLAGIQVFRAAEAQKKATHESRSKANTMMTSSFDTYDVKGKAEVMSFVERHEMKIGDHVLMTIDIDENGKVLDASYMIRMTGRYTYDDLKKMKAKDVEKEMRDIYGKTKGFKELFVYPEVTEVPVKFSDYMNNYIDNIREKSEWSKDYEYKVGEHTYITHCTVSYSEGKSKKKDDDRLKVVYDVQQKNFKRTNW